MKNTKKSGQARDNNRKANKMPAVSPPVPDQEKGTEKLANGLASNATFEKPGVNRATRAKRREDNIKTTKQAKLDLHFQSGEII